jgi:hypothetical protein
MITTPLKEVTFHVRQAVAWPFAPLGIAQIEELRRRTVRLWYRCRTGTERRPIVNAEKLAAVQAEQRSPILPIKDPFARGALPREKTYAISAPD